MTAMKKDRALGLLREILTAGGALIFGMAEERHTAAIGIIVAIAAVAWALSHHEGMAILQSALRKCFSLLPGVLLAFGVIDEERAVSLAGLLTPLFALVWSFLDNGKKS
jgi:hypothetical protein